MISKKETLKGTSKGDKKMNEEKIEALKKIINDKKVVVEHKCMDGDDFENILIQEITRTILQYRILTPDAEFEELPSVKDALVIAECASTCVGKIMDSLTK